MIFDREAFLNSYNRSNDERMKKKTMEEELAQKQQLMREQAALEDQALTPELKLFRLMKQNPNEFRAFMEAKNAMSPYQEAMLGIQRGQLGIQSQRAGAENMTPQQRNFNFLDRAFPGMPDEQKLQILFPGSKKKSGFSFAD